VSVDFGKMQEIFLAAVELHRPEDWDAYLDQACAGDEELRRQVSLLLKAHREAGSVPGAAASGQGPTVAHQPAAEAAGVVIGPYKLLQQIGEGGMGTVFMAEQTRPVQRKVALKIIKPGMDSRQVIARFEAERQALALMDHPNIAKVLDAGTTDSGRPYFVMELVKGAPITRYCDENRLTPKERLALFIPVCQAVQHAHQKGIIHRDLKPSNVLVALYDGKPVPKVIDFGVAKATGQKLTERTLFTEFGAIVGTLEYMSPEQAGLNQLDIDTRSDIYSLGVLLYELLTGSTPLERKRLKEAAMLEVLRLIREEEPPKPSTRLSTADESPSVAAHRGVEPKKLSALVRGELDWIVMKALDKDRSRRYETANGLAQDIERYLHDEPVQACPPSAVYRFRKFARRNKTGLAMAGLVLFFLVLLGGGVGWMVRDWGAQQAVLEREVTLALEEAETVYKRDKLPEALAAVKRAEALLAGGGGSEELRQRVRQWRADLDLIAQLQEATIQAVKKNPVEGHWTHEEALPAYVAAFRAYGFDRASLSAEQAAQQIASRPPEIQLALIAGLDHWIDLESRFGKKSSADQQQQAWLKALVQAADPDPWRRRMRVAVERRDYEALAELAGSQDLSKQAPYTLECLAGLLCDTADKRDLGILVLRRAQQAHAGNFWINYALGVRLLEAVPSPRDEAVRFSSNAVALQPDSAEARLCLGLALRRQGRLAQAITEIRKAVELQPDFFLAYTNLGVTLCAQGKVDEAIIECRKAVEMNPTSGHAQACLAWCLCIYPRPELRDRAQALEMAKKAVLLETESTTTWQVLGWAYYRTGDWQASIEALEKSCKLQSNGIGDYAQWFFLAMAHWKLGQNEEARRWYDKAVQSETTWPEFRARLRAEAAALLGIKEPPRARPDEAPADKQ
jgi:serine/threonine protein kinase/Tfp pilus assembly protein PilF